MRWWAALARTLAACAVACAVAVSAVVLLWPIARLTPTTDQRALWTLALSVAIVMTVIGGLPAHFVLRSRGGNLAHSYAVAGAVVGVAPFALYALIVILSVVSRLAAGESFRALVDDRIWSFVLRLGLIGSCAGAAGAWAFWLVAVFDPSAPRSDRRLQG